MAKDTQGNDLGAVAVPVTGAICVVPYDEENVITRAMISKKLATPNLPEAYARDKACLGLIASDGGPQDAGESDDAIEFWQQGYSLNGDPTLTTAFTIAEDNDFTREFCFGEKPDEDGVVAVNTLTPDTKWMAYYEEVFKNGSVQRRAGVVQVTGNEPGQSERGSVKGRAITVTWLNDDHYEGAKYIEALCRPEDAEPSGATGSTGTTGATGATGSTGETGA